MSGQGEIEYQLKLAINSTGYIFLLDEPSIVGEMSGFSSFYRGFCDSISGVFLEFRGAEISEQALLKGLNAVIPRTAAESEITEHTYDSLHDLMDRHRQGLISIKASQTLTAESIHVIAGVVNYARQNQLTWKVFLVADTLLMDDLVVAQLSVDQCIPDRAIHDETSLAVKPVRSKRNPGYKKLRSKNGSLEQIQTRLRQSLSTTSAKMLLAAFALAMGLAFYLKGL